MAPGGIEPTTFALLARRSNQLSYGALIKYPILILTRIWTLAGSFAGFAAASCHLVDVVAKAE